MCYENVAIKFLCLVKEFIETVMDDSSVKILSNNIPQRVFAGFASFPGSQVAHEAAPELELISLSGQGSHFSISADLNVPMGQSSERSFVT